MTTQAEQYIEDADFIPEGYTVQAITQDITLYKFADNSLALKDGDVFAFYQLIKRD